FFLGSLLQESVSITASLLQETPALGNVCNAFQVLEQHVEAARNNRHDLTTLCDLCRAVIVGFLEPERRRNFGLVRDRCKTLEHYVNRAKDVANRCVQPPRLAQVIMARKICREISSVRKDLADFCVAINLAVNSSILDNQTRMLNEAMGRLATMPATRADFDEGQEEIKRLRKEMEDIEPTRR
ncbi:unnamed protein product, partial [Ectocarpus sp. 12 AP-2014]